MTAQPMIHGQGSPGGTSIVTRFAPSPTGRLHLGHGWSAILAHDLARTAGGRFLLRIEDIDSARCRAEHVEAILADLSWLGLTWHGYAVQSERLALYAAALARLRARGLVYRCFCTRAAIAAASAPHGMETAYPGTCRTLSEAQSDARAGEPHAWRLDVARALSTIDYSPAKAGAQAFVVEGGPPPSRENGGLAWHDATAGWTAADPRSAGDVVLARKDAPTSYHLAVTVDDAAQGVTDVVRGVDLFAATHVHRLLQALLDLPTPRYHHHALLIGPDGERLAKRHGSPTLEARRLAGEDGRKLAATLRARGVGFGSATP